MTYYDPASGLSVIVLPGSPGNPDFITYYPSIMSDSTAAADALLAEESAKSFMQTQWRAAASNMVGIGVISSDWA